MCGYYLWTAVIIYEIIRDMTAYVWFRNCAFTCIIFLQRSYSVTVLSYIGVVNYWLCHMGSSPVDLHFENLLFLFVNCYSFSVVINYFMFYMLAHIPKFEGSCFPVIVYGTMFFEPFATHYGTMLLPQKELWNGESKIQR